MGEEEKSVKKVLSLPIHLAERVLKLVQEAVIYRTECAVVGTQVERLAQLLRAVVRLSATATSFYDRPFTRVAADVSKTLNRAVSLVRRCKHSGAAVTFVRQVFSISSTGDFRRLSALLEASITDSEWLLSTVVKHGGDIFLPPIANNDPILAWVWFYIASLQPSRASRERTDAASELALLAGNSDQYKKIIVQEGGVPPLVKLLKEGGWAESQVAAANALCYLGTTNGDTVRCIVQDLEVPEIVKVLGDSPIRVKASVANLVAKMAEFAQEEFGRENAVGALVTLLSMDMALLQSSKPSFQSLVQTNKQFAGKDQNQQHHHYRSSHSLSKEREREGENEELKLKLKTSCAEALWKLCRESLINSKKLAETNGLLVLAKLIEKEKGELQFNCLMTLVEIAAVAETNAEIRQSSFKLSSPTGKTVCDQLLRVVGEESSTALKVPAIKAIGCLARLFRAKETGIVKSLVVLLGQEDRDVAAEAVIALGKFASLENFNCVKHSKAIIEFDGIGHLMLLLKDTEHAQLHMQALTLLSCLALNVANSKALEDAGVLGTLEDAGVLGTLEVALRSHLQYPNLRDLLAKAISHLTLYQAGSHANKQADAV